MKTKGLFLLIIVILFFGCNQKNKKAEPDFYKNLFTGEVLNKSEYNEFIYDLHNKKFDSIKGEKNISMHFYQLIVSNDSIIRPFKYEVRIGNEYLIRVESFDKIGMKISPQTFLTLDGDSVQIGGTQSKPTLINLWFIHCGGCVAEMSALNKLKEKYADKMNFIAITFEDKESVAGFLNKKEFNFIHIVNAEDFINYIGTKPYPENIFINREGSIEYIEGGLGNQETKYFDSLIEKLLLSKNITNP